jgi:cytochrome c oxidase assembly factor CtaG
MNPSLVPLFALVFTVKGLLLLVAAVIFAVLAFVGLTPPRSDWPRGLASVGFCLAMVAWFIWASGG